MSASFHLEPGSFRDRTGRVFYHNQDVYRFLSPEALRQWETLSSKSFYPRLMSAGRIVRTERVMNPLPDIPMDEWAAVLHHERIPFVSYPYEWAFGMLKDAALLQLDLLLDAMQEDMILKDSSPFNFQWIGTQPVFIDVLSFEKLEPGEPWVGYRQFCQMFLYPLFLQAYKKIPYHPWLRGSIDGITPQDCNSFMSLRDIFRRGVFSHVYLQSKLQESFGATEENVKTQLRNAGFRKEMIRNNVRNLRNIIRLLEWKHFSSEWSNYVNQTSYSKEDQNRKESFVRKTVSSQHWRLVWDLGCNVGNYARIAAQNSDYVVAMDADALAVQHLYRELSVEQSRNILPLVMNLADASPGIGWRGLERKSLGDRGKPELVLGLALIHHVVISANIPLREFLEWIRDLGSAFIIEFVTKQDPMVQTLLRNRIDQYTDYTVEYFEKYLAELFGHFEKETLQSGTRMLYFTRPA